jgi:predicted aspartyl protease
MREVASFRESICKSSSKSTASKSQRQLFHTVDSEELLSLNNADKVRAYCNLRVNGKLVHFLLDCGATVNVLPLAEATTVNPKLTDLRPPKSRLTMFDGTELKTLGMLTANVIHPLSGKRRRMEFYVATKHDRAILGMQACTEMDLLSVKCTEYLFSAGHDVAAEVKYRCHQP